ncbi:MAG: hypothetical protein QW254_00070 [Desulfurococcaceae archaeon]
MKSQIIMISAFIAMALLVFATVTMYTAFFPYIGGQYVKDPSLEIRYIVESRPVWTAQALGEKISTEIGALYIRVNITIYDPLQGVKISEDIYEKSPIGINLSEIYMRKHVFVRTSRDAKLYIYDIEVGYE